MDDDDHLVQLMRLRHMRFKSDCLFVNIVV